MYYILFLSFGNISKKIIWNDCLWSFAIVNMEENLKVITQLCKNDKTIKTLLPVALNIKRYADTQAGSLYNCENLRHSVYVFT